MGNVTYVVPGIHPTFSIDAVNGNHTSKLLGDWFFRLFSRSLFFFSFFLVVGFLVLIVKFFWFGLAH
jgi:hypothetical protein